MQARRRLLISQPYVPRYREAFFNRLERILASDGVRLEVVVPRDHPSHDPSASRGDATEATPSWLVRLEPEFSASIGDRWVYSLGAGLRPGSGDAVVVGLQASLPDAWRMLLHPRRRFTVGLWGHVGAFVAPEHRLDVAAERWLMRRSDHIFAYTTEGADLAQKVVPASRITAVQNSVDTAYARNVQQPGLATELESRYALRGTPCLGYVGGLDRSKRIDFLAASLEVLHQLDPRIKVLVAGQGPDRHLLRAAETRGQLIHLGFGSDEIKGAMAHLCSAILMPGRVGLIAVDALAMGRPVVTIRGSRHGPEFAYLREGESVLSSPDDPAAFAELALSTVNRPRAQWAHPSLEAMASNFASGVMRMMADDHDQVLRDRAESTRAFRHAGVAPDVDTTTSGESRPAVAWVTNFAAPYRRPIWEQLARQVDLTVLLTSDRGSYDASPRGSDWFSGLDGKEYQVRQVATRTRRFLGVDVALARRNAHDLLPVRGHVLLGGWESPVYWQLARAARRRGSRVVGFYESTSHSQRFKQGPIAAARGMFFKRLDAVVVPSKESLAAVHAMGVDLERIHVASNPVDVDLFRAAADRRDSRPAVGSVGHRYLYVGQLIERKNVRSLITAFRSIADPHDSLTIVGSGSLLEELTWMARGDSRIEFVHHVPYQDMPAIMADHHTLVLPSLVEVFGLVVSEALASGLHAVVSRDAGVSTTVEHMAGVWLCSPDTVSVMSAMAASREAWTGWIADPEIRSHSPSALVSSMVSALRLP